jgi:hypothetical protein
VTLRRRFALLAIVLLTACAQGPVRRQVTSEPEDWFHYRRFRGAATLEEKLTAAWAYLKEQPHGRFRGEVRSWFLAAERDYRAVAEHRPTLLERYLIALPDAPNRSLVADRLAELQLSREQQRRRERRFSEQAREFEEQLAQAETLRRELLDSFSGWVRRLAEIPKWGVPVAALGSGMDRWYASEAPLPKCNDERCSKALSWAYAVPDQRRLVARRAVYDVVLALREGMVVRASLAGPQLFDRLSEASQLSAVAPSDALARAEAIGRVVQLTQAALEPALPAAVCAKEALGRVVLHRECRGLRVRVIAAETASEDDVVEFEPVTGSGRTE